MRNVVASRGGRRAGSSGADPALTLEFSDRVFTRFQFGAVSLLVALAVLHVGIHRAFGEGVLNSLTAVFDVVDEASIPTVFSMLNLLIASALLFVIYLNARAARETLSRYWLLLSLVFLVLSVDEVAQIHERVGKVVGIGESSIRATEFNPDFIVTGVFALIVLIAFVPFLRRLDRTTRGWFLVAGGLFVSGAFGMELVELALLSAGVASAGDALLDARAVVEEAGEMYGVALFNVVLIGLLPQRRITLT